MNLNLKRGILSVIAVVGFGLFSSYIRPTPPLSLGEVAAMQLQKSDDSYLNVMTVMAGYPANGISVLVLIVVLGLIWCWNPVSKM